MEILFHPRNENGNLILSPEQRVGQRQFLYTLAIRRGLPHDRAIAWAESEIRKAMTPPKPPPSKPREGLPNKYPRRGKRG